MSTFKFAPPVKNVLTKSELKSGNAYQFYTDSMGDRIPMQGAQVILVANADQYIGLLPSGNVKSLDKMSTKCTFVNVDITFTHSEK